MSPTEPPTRNRFLGIVLLSISVVILIGFGAWSFVFRANAQFLIERGLRLADENPAESERLFRRAIGTSPTGNSDASLALAWLCEYRGALDEAETAFAAVDPSISRSDLLLLFARQALKSNHFRWAIRALEPMRKRDDSETPEALQLLWNTYSVHGTQDDAFAVGSELLRAQPHNHSLRLERIRALKGAYREVECLAAIREALPFDLPPESRRELEYLLLEQWIVLGDVPEAWKQIQSLQKRYGKSPQLESREVDLYRAEGRLDEALKAITELFPAIEHMPVAYLTRGVIFLDLGRYEEAVLDLNRAVSSEPMNEGARFKLSMAYRGLGNDELANKHREIWASIRQKRIRIIELLQQQRSSFLGKNACVELSRLHRELGDFERARYWQQRAGIADSP